jgi:hypothetical protein
MPDDKRQAAFKDLLEAQDRGVSVRESRDLVATQYGMGVALEREGIDGSRRRKR